MNDSLFRGRTSPVGRVSLMCGVAACLMVGAWLLAPADAVGGGKTPTAKSIIDKAMDFHGGILRLKRDLPMVRTEESEMIIDGERIPLKTEWQYSPPDKRAFQCVIKIGGLTLSVKQGLVGDKGWVKFGPAPAVDLSTEQVLGQSWEHDNHVRNILNLAYSELFTMSEPKAVRFQEHDCWQIDCTNKKTKQTLSGFFDKATGQVHGDDSERVVATLGDDKTREKAAKFRVTFNSLLDVDGIKMPSAMTILREGTPVVEVRKSKVRFVDSVDPKLFIKPE